MKEVLLKWPRRIKDEERAEVSYEKPQTTISFDTCEKEKGKEGLGGKI